MIKRVDSGGQVHLVTNIRKPRKWRRYEWIQSANDRQYIDIGILLPLNFKYLITFDLLSISSAVRVCGYRNTSNTNTGSILMLNYPSGKLAYINAFNLYYSAADAFTNTGKYTISVSNTDIIVNGSIKKSYNTISYVLPTVSFFIFGYNNAGSVYEEGVLYTKIYEFKLWENDTLIRHMVPAQYQGQYGMWDLVEDKFYPNKGIGTFTVGPEIKNYDEIDEVRKEYSILPSGVELYDYILSSGTQRIDTGIVASYPMEFKTNLCYTDTLTDERDFFGNYNAGPNTACFVCGKRSNKWYQWAGNAFSTGTVVQNLFYELNYKFNPTSGRVITVDGIATTSTVTNNTQNSYNIGLFSGASSKQYDACSVKMKYALIYINNILVRNFLPCTYLGEPGMWDTVTNLFYRNLGTGTFALGNKIILVEREYLATTGLLSINNNIILTEGHTLTYDIIFKYDATGVRRLMGPSPNASAYFGVNASNNYEKVSSTDNIPVGNIDHIYEHFDAINGKVTRQLNNMLPYTFNHAIDKMIGFPTFIFALNRPTYSTGSGQYFYSGKILYDGKVARDYVPCSYNGTPGLWDKVEWKFYGNAGSGSFTLGPEKASGIYPVWRSINIEDTFTFKQTPNVRKTVATLLGIKGNSIAWNLLISESYPNTNAANRTNNSDGSFTATPSGTSTYSLYYPTTYSLILVNSKHRYYMSSYIKSDNGLLILGLIYYSGSGPTTGYNILITPTTSLQKYAFVTTTNVTSGRLLGVATYASNKPTTFTIKNFMCIDLTLIYGAGNEPTTAEQFETDYYKWFGKPLTYEAYDAGSLRCTKCTGLKSVGFNQFNIEGVLEGKSTNSDNGVITNTSDCATTQPIRVISGQSYYSDMPLRTNIYKFIFFDENDKYLTRKGGSTVAQIINVPVDAYYVRLNTWLSSVINDKFSFNISNPNLNGIYKPYNSQTISIPVTSITGKLNGSGNSVVIFPDGMKSTGDRWDEIYVELGVTKAIKRIGSIDMGSANNLVLRANFSTTGDCYINGFGSAKGISGIRLVTCSKFSSMPTYSNLISSMSEYVAAEGGYKTVNFRVKDHTLTKEQVKEYITGTILYYELEVYLEYIVDNFTLPILYGVELGGTEEVISSDSTSVAPTLQLQYIV